MSEQKLTIGRIVHYRTAGGICYPAMMVRELSEGIYSFQVNKGYNTDGVIVRHQNPDEELAWHWPQECPQGR
jgi:hypothetical protein